MTRPKKPANWDYRQARRGNTTSGESRRGNRDGRPPVYPEGTITHSLLLAKLSDREYAIAILLGNGSPAQGVRRALRSAALDYCDRNAPLSRYETDTYIRLRKAKMRRGEIPKDYFPPSPQIDKEFAPLIGGADWDDTQEELP